MHSLSGALRDRAFPALFAILVTLLVLCQPPSAQAQLLLPSWPTTATTRSSQPLVAKLPGGLQTPAVPTQAAAVLQPQDSVVGPHTVCEGDSPQYSGLLPAGDGAEYFFWLAGSRSDTPQEDPLIMWLSGGPGCSSLYALLTENGPCFVTGSAVSEPRRGPGNTTRNQWSWTEAANVVWVDQPGNVGFSTRPNQYTANEAAVSEHMLVFMKNFYGRFPELERVPLYIFGESYGGHYVPAVGSRILQATQNGELSVVLQGIAIGNGLVNPAPQLASKPDFAYTGGEGGSLGGGVVNWWEYDSMQQLVPRCMELINTCQTEHVSCYSAFRACMMSGMTLATYRSDLNPYDLRKPCDRGGNGPAICYNIGAEDAFVRSPRVQSALGVHPTRGWDVCNFNVVEAFIDSGDWMARYDGEVAALLGNGVPVLIYNGDTDSMIDWIGSKAMTSSLEWIHQSVWAAAGDLDWNVAGIAKGRERSVGGLTFLQIYDSGHMVPMDQPEAMLAVVREFVRPSSSRWKNFSWCLTNCTANTTQAVAAGTGYSVVVIPAFVVTSVMAVAAVFLRRRRCGSGGIRAPLLATS